jgi:hypothetical protein
VCVLYKQVLVTKTLAAPLPPPTLLSSRTIRPRQVSRMFRTLLQHTSERKGKLYRNTFLYIKPRRQLTKLNSKAAPDYENTTTRSTARTRCRQTIPRTQTPPEHSYTVKEMPVSMLQRQPLRQRLLNDRRNRPSVLHNTLPTDSVSHAPSESSRHEHRQDDKFCCADSTAHYV